MNPRAKQIKRLMDVAVAGGGLIVLSPVLLVTSLLVRQAMGSPILFRQKRPGLHGRPFIMYKFRTMRDAVDQRGRPLPDSERLTPLGRFLRSSSLDELPELFNILRGDMSLVGPRPLLMEYLDRYTPEQARRHEVKPGLTGWAQINGRQDILFSQRVAHDIWYVDHQSPLLDLKILFQTVPMMLFARGVRNGQDVREVDDLPPARSLPEGG